MSPSPDNPVQSHTAKAYVRVENPSADFTAVHISLRKAERLHRLGMGRLSGCKTRIRLIESDQRLAQHSVHDRWTDSGLISQKELMALPAVGATPFLSLITILERSMAPNPRPGQVNIKMKNGIECVGA